MNGLKIIFFIFNATLKTIFFVFKLIFQTQSNLLSHTLWLNDAQYFEMETSEGGMSKNSPGIITLK